MAKLVTSKRVFQETIRVEWKIENLHSSGDICSEEFSLLEARCFLHTGNNSQLIYLRKKDDNESFLLYHVIAFIETQERLQKFYQRVDLKILTKAWNCIWKITAEEAKCVSGEVTFVLMCVPYDSSSEIEHKSVQTLPHMDPVPCFESLSSDFSNLLVCGAKPDVKLKCGDSTIPAHKLVLSARSEVFSAMFSNDMLESRTGSVDIADLDQPVLNQLIEYLYSGKVTNMTMDNAQSLYESGNRYAVHALKDKCRAFLLENLNDENACNLLVFADFHSDKAFKDAAIEYFVNDKSLFQKAAWMKFYKDQPMLALEVYHICFVKH